MSIYASDFRTCVSFPTTHALIAIQMALTSLKCQAVISIFNARQEQISNVLGANCNHSNVNWSCKPGDSHRVRGKMLSRLIPINKRNISWVSLHKVDANIQCSSAGWRPRNDARKEVGSIHTAILRSGYLQDSSRRAAQGMQTKRASGSTQMMQVELLIKDLHHKTESYNYNVWVNSSH
jgi:hypothetical protein